MKKMLGTLILLTVFLTLTGCVKFNMGLDEDSPTYVVTPSWPENEYTIELPKPETNDNSVIQYCDYKDSTVQNTYSIQISDLTLAQYETYKSALYDSGFRLNRYYYIDEDGTSSVLPNEIKCGIGKIGFLYYTYKPVSIPCYCSEWGKGTTSVSLQYIEPYEDEKINSSLSITITLNEAPFLYNLEKQDVFPENEYSEFVKAPTFASECTIASGNGKFGEKDAYCIRLDGVSREQYRQYIELLSDSEVTELPLSVVTVDEEETRYVGSPIYEGTRYAGSPFGNVKQFNPPTIVCDYWQGKITKDSMDVYCFVIYCEPGAYYYIDPSSVRNRNIGEIRGEIRVNEEGSVETDINIVGDGNVDGEASADSFIIISIMQVGHTESESEK